MIDSLQSPYVSNPAGWQGHRYWMAHTPYPGADRENPTVCYSDNLIDWHVPVGAPDPIVTATEAQAAGLTWNSDTDLTILPNGSLQFVWRMYKDTGGNAERIYRKVSADAVTWGAKQQLLDGPGTLDTILSPTVEVEDDGTFSMWTANNTAGTVSRRTSADGVTWSAPTLCTIPAGCGPWHLDVVKFEGSYHMLLDCLIAGSAARLVYLTSPDGLVWSGVNPYTRDVPLSGTRYDSGGRHYRATFIPKGGGRWDVIAPGIPYNGRTRTTPDPGATEPWRLILYPNLPLPAPAGGY